MNLVHTYSIVARDPETGEMGTAVQSHFFGTGAVVPWAEAGVGAIATQAMAEVSYGPCGLESMRMGKSAPNALRELLEADQGRDIRQVAMIDADGRIAAHTGTSCIAYAGHHVGDQFSVQANMMLTDEVVPAMRDAFVLAKGPLPERMLAALDAAESVGGDIRGRQSAAMLVVDGERTNKPWGHRLVELRVEDDPQPLKELRRLLVLRRAYAYMSEADKLAMSGEIDAAGEIMTEAKALAPDNLEIAYWYGVSLAVNGRMDAAAAELNRVFAEDPNWAELLRRLPDANLVPQYLIDEILAATGRS